MKKRYLVFNEKEENVYNLFVETTDKSTTYILSTNDNDLWSEHYKNTEIVKITDDGSLEYKITIEGKIGEMIDASQLDGLRLVLNFMDKEYNDGKYFYKLFEDIDTNYLIL